MSACPDSLPLPEIDLSKDALFFDVDGTLLNLAPRPEEVVVSETLRESLTHLRTLCGGAVALISGRRLAVVDLLFAPLKLAVVGCHGAEMRRTPDGPVEDFAPPVPDAIRQAFADLGEIDPRIVVEDKVFTLAFHYRAAMDKEAELLASARARLKPFEPAFTLLHGKAIIEIKSASFNKGIALHQFLSFAPFKDRRPIYCGDDTTDESAFAALPAFGGVGISVGRHMQNAGYMMGSPKDLRGWLRMLAARKGALS